MSNSRKLETLNRFIVKHRRKIAQVSEKEEEKKTHSHRYVTCNVHILYRLYIKMKIPIGIFSCCNHGLNCVCVFLFVQSDAHIIKIG